MAKRKQNPADEVQTNSEAPETDGMAPVVPLEASAQEGGDAENEIVPPPPRLNGEVLPNVQVCGASVTGCNDAEVKNYMATADFVCRQVGVQLADMWKGICKTAQKAGKESEKAAKVSLAVSIVIDHSNLQMMDTKVTTSYSEKHSVSGQTQEDLRQTEFVLKPE
jgi:hypothetical protein